MASGTQSARPAELTAGDSYRWREAAPTGAPGVSAAYHFRGDEPAAYFKAIGAEDETDSDYWIFTLAAVDTAEMPPGRYSVKILVSDSDTGDRTTTDAGGLTLNPNPDLPPEQSHAARMVELLESHIEGRLPSGLESHNINGQPISKISFLDAKELLRNYKNQLRQEIEARKMRDGRGSATVKIQF